MMIIQPDDSAILWLCARWCLNLRSNTGAAVSLARYSCLKFRILLEIERLWVFCLQTPADQQWITGPGYFCLFSLLSCCHLLGTFCPQSAQGFKFKQNPECSSWLCLDTKNTIRRTPNRYFFHDLPDTGKWYTSIISPGKECKQQI